VDKQEDNLDLVSLSTASSYQNCPRKLDLVEREKETVSQDLEKKFFRNTRID
jgi:hypothetical protein